jgi:hypothetical protein
MDNMLVKAGIKRDDDAINSRSDYDEHADTNKYIKVNDGVVRNSLVVGIILTLIIMAVVILPSINSNIKLNSLYSFTVVSLFMTIAESYFVYWYNIQRIFNNIIDAIDNEVTFDGYLKVKKINSTIPNAVHSELKKSYEHNLTSITFVMLIPILLISVFMISFLSGKVTISLHDATAIIVNILLLAVTFGMTFVNLGMKQSEQIDTKQIAESFDPFDDTHRFQTKYDFVNNPIFTSSFAGIITISILLSILVLIK